MEFEKLRELEKSFNDFCKKNDVSSWISHASNTKVFKDEAFELNIDIYFGDWKHDHLYANYLVEEWCKENNYLLSNVIEEITESDGSDCYSAIHKCNIFLNKELGIAMKSLFS